MFGALVCYGVRDAIDGTSNTLAMAENGWSHQPGWLRNSGEYGSDPRIGQPDGLPGRCGTRPPEPIRVAPYGRHDAALSLG